MQSQKHLWKRKLFAFYSLFTCFWGTSTSTWEIITGRVTDKWIKKYLNNLRCLIVKLSLHCLGGWSNCWRSSGGGRDHCCRLSRCQLHVKPIKLRLSDQACFVLTFFLGETWNLSKQLKAIFGIDNGGLNLIILIDPGWFLDAKHLYNRPPLSLRCSVVQTSAAAWSSTIYG